MVLEPLTAAELWHGLLEPLIRLVAFLSLGMLVGNFIEALNWTRRVGVLARPLILAGHLSPVTGAAFSMAFLSGVAANTMLAEAYDQGRLRKRELILANLFNSLPRFFLHLPTVFFMTAPLIRGAAFIYVGVTLTAAVLQTMLVVLAGRVLLPDSGPAEEEGPERKGARAVGWRQALAKSRKRFRKRISRVIRFTVPVYILFFLLQHQGAFDLVKRFLVEHAPFLAWLHPESLGIIVLHVTAEFTAGLAAAGALLDASSMGYRDVVLALLVGNILAAPVRAVRHQFPYYAGIFSPRLGLELIAYSQFFRIGVIFGVTVAFYFFTV